MEERNLVRKVGAFAKTAAKAELLTQYLRARPLEAGGVETHPLERGAFVVHVVPSGEKTHPYKMEVWVTKSHRSYFTKLFHFPRSEFLPLYTESFPAETCPEGHPDTVKLSDYQTGRLISAMWHKMPNKPTVTRQRLNPWFENQLTLGQLGPKKLFRLNLADQLEAYFKQHRETAAPLAEALDTQLGTRRYSEALGLVADTPPAPQISSVPEDITPHNADDRAGGWADRYRRAMETANKSGELQL